MARQLTCGFESGTTERCVGGVIGTPPSGMTGSYCAQVNNNQTVTAAYATPVNEGFAGLRVNLADKSDSDDKVYLLDATAALLLSLRFRSTDSKIGLYRGGSLIASSTHTFNPGTTYYLEIHGLINTDAGTGKFGLKVNGVTEIDFTGVTQPGANNLIGSVVFHQASSNYSQVDDIVLNDTTGGADNSWPGIKRLYKKTLNSDSAVALTRGGTNTGSNYGQLNETPANTAQYVYSNTPGTKDLYGMAALAAPPAGTTIDKVVIMAQCQLSDGSGSMNLPCKVNATEAAGATQALTTAWAWYEQVVSVNPDGGGAWDLTSVNAALIGFNVD